MKGKKRPDVIEYNRKYKPLQIKEKNPQWKGGISKLPYSIEFNKQLKYKIKERDKYTCQICNIIIKNNMVNNKIQLIIHHINYDKQNCNEDNLISLCNSCHGKTTTENRQYWKEYFKNE